MEQKKNEININYNGKEYILCEYMYGVLKMDHNSPLCCVSEANNSFSIDYWKGCSFQCAYCHVQGIYEDLDENYKMYKNPIPRSRFSIEEIAESNNLTMLSESDVAEIIAGIVQNNESMVKERQMGAMGPLMGMCMKELKGKADGGMVNKIVREEIQKLI